MFAICIICYNERHPSHPERTFHRFPKNEAMKIKWIEAIGSSCSSTSGMVCSDHFLPEDFCEPVGYGYVPKRILQDNAIPKLKIVGSSMTEIRLQHENLKEDPEQRVVVHPLNSSEKENIFCKTEETEKSMIKPEIDFDFFTQCNEALEFDNKNLTLSYGNENLTLSSIGEYVPVNYGFENVPLSISNENVPLNCDYESMSLNCNNENTLLKDGNENVTDPDLKRIISGNADIIDLSQEFDNVTEVNSTLKKKEDDIETKLKRVVIKMPNIGLRSFTEDDFTSTIAWKIFVKFILHNRKETRALKYRSIRLEKKIESYQQMFNILRRGGRVRMETKS